MDKYIKQSIDMRKDAIFKAYKLDKAGEKKVADLFAEMEKLGAKCKDVSEFEAEFSKSPLNQKYLDLFTEIATSSSPKAAASKASLKEVGKMVAGGAVAGIAENAVDQAINDVVPTRAAVHQKISDAARSVPVLGDAIDIGQKASYATHLGKLFKRKKK